VFRGLSPPLSPGATGVLRRSKFKRSIICSVVAVSSWSRWNTASYSAQINDWKNALTRTVESPTDHHHHKAFAFSTTI